MRIFAQRSYILAAAAVAVTLASAVCVEGASGGGKNAAPHTASGAQADSSEVQALRGAYMTLSIADHDYKGHRVRAMRALERACDLLGSDIRGDGKGKEPQAVSDAQLKESQAAIQKVRDGIAAGSQPKVVGHLDKAIKEIGIALTIK
jgi:hypothetical protein